MKSDNYFEEKKAEWGMQRWQKFTASEIYQLKEPGDRGKSLFGGGAISYIRQVACEHMTEYEHNPFEGTWEMREGKTKEPDANRLYTRVFHILNPDPLYRLQYFGDHDPYFKPWDKASGDAGASADGVIWHNEQPVKGYEFKCPKRDTHFNYLLQLSDHQDAPHEWLKYADQNEDREMKRTLKKYYGQVQFNMMCWGVKEWDWCSYNEHFRHLREQMIIINVPYDEPYCIDLELRIKQAIRKKYEFIEKIKTQWTTN